MMDFESEFPTATIEKIDGSNDIESSKQER